jgi:acetate kinase
MGYTPAGGITMGTRSGDLDPGVMLELAKRYDSQALSDLVYHRMGLLALSAGESGEMHRLLESRSPAAGFAVDYFCRQVRAAIGAFAAKAGGMDALVFSGGIGEHAPQIRERICQPLGFLGFSLDAAANQTNSTLISATGFKPVLRIAADEEAVIRDLVVSLMGDEAR